MANSFDLSKPLSEALKDLPEASAVLHEIGFDNLPDDKSLAQLCEDEGVAPSIVLMALESSGIDTEGYVPDDSSTEATQKLDEVMNVLLGDHDDEPVSNSPMFAHMHMAVKRAQKNGDLPK